MGDAMHWSAYHDVGWTIVDAGAELDPEQYLGEFGELPAEGEKPGTWCDVVVHDSLGEMRWTFMLVHGRSQSVTGDRGESGSAPLSPPKNGRRQADRALREWEREDEAAAASSAPFSLRSAARTDGKQPGRRLRLLRSVDFA
jgi:hypothetical protein